MNRTLNRIVTTTIAAALLIVLIVCCTKKEEDAGAVMGIFPSEVINLADINSPYDDYNSALGVADGSRELLFSTKRNTPGNGSFSYISASLEFVYNKCNKSFDISARVPGNSFLAELASDISTAGNDLGPFRIVCRVDGREYTVTTTEMEDGTLSLIYYRYMPWFGTAIPDIGEGSPVTRLNSVHNDGYFSIDHTQTKVFFSSDRDGSYDIYYAEKPRDVSLADWFSMSGGDITKVDSINSSSNDMAPLVFHDLILFASDRPGGLGGYDIYYSVFEDGKWGAPVNFGPPVNSPSNEFRPVIGSQTGFKDHFLIFSSDREGGKGGYDLYFTGIKIPDPPATFEK